MIALQSPSFVLTDSTARFRFVDVFVFVFEFTIDRSCVYIIKHKIPLATKESSERIIGLFTRSQLINIHDKIDIRIIEVRIIEFAGLYYD